MSLVSGTGTGVNEKSECDQVERVAYDESIIDVLPDEVLEMILFRVSPYGDLRSCSLVCRRWKFCVANVMKKRRLDFHKAVAEMRLIWSEAEDTDLVPDSWVTRRYSHSAVYDDNSHSMFVFGGCTSTATTFNDLWRFDLTKRVWSRPLSTGAYPSPKACAVLIKDDTKLYLFGGWTHPSLYPLHQSWKLFNKMHSYCLKTSCWAELSPASEVKPPTMAGHSATIHRGFMIVFGGLQKQRSSIGHFSSSSDVWSFNLQTHLWTHEDIPEPRPKPRYGQSQLYIDENHLLILGGCGGPNNTISDVWLLIMEPPSWRWERCTVANPQHGVQSMWCHPAVRVGNFAVMLGKSRLEVPQKSLASSGSGIRPGVDSRSTSPGTYSQDHRNARWNVIPQLNRGVNRGYGAMRRHRPLPSSSSSVEGLPVTQGAAGRNRNAFQSSISLNFDPPPAERSQGDRRAMREKLEMPDVQQQPSTSQGRLTDSSPFQPPPSGAPRMQAFSVNPAPSIAPPASSSLSRQLENQQRRLEVLKRMEQKCRNISSSGSGSNGKQVIRNSPKEEISLKTAANLTPKLCFSLALHVLDISKAVSDRLVTWKEVKTTSNNYSTLLADAAPEETILYSLVVARGEIVMFGGIQKNVSGINRSSTRSNGGRVGALGDDDAVSNSVWFLKIPNYV